MWAINEHAVPLLLMLTYLAAANGQVCYMCPNNGGITCPDTVLRNDGQTCAGMAAEMAGLQGDTCKDYQYWGEACCVQGECPPDLPPLDTPPPLSSGEPNGGVLNAMGVARGPHDPCHLCRDGRKPTKPYVLINMLGYGEGTCIKWHQFALEGNVVRHQCDALMCK